MQEEKKVLMSFGGATILVPLSQVQALTELFIGAKQVSYRYHDSECHYYVSDEPLSISIKPLAEDLPTKPEVDAMIADREAKKQAVKDLADHAQLMRNLESATPDTPPAKAAMPQIETEDAQNAWI